MAGRKELGEALARLTEAVEAERAEVVAVVTALRTTITALQAKLEELEAGVDLGPEIATIAEIETRLGRISEA